MGCGFSDNLISRGFAGCFISLFGLSGASGLPLNPADPTGGGWKEPPQAVPASASEYGKGFFWPAGIKSSPQPRACCGGIPPASAVRPSAVVGWTPS